MAEFKLDGRMKVKTLKAFGFTVVNVTLTELQ
jgi:hypothetical protein